MLVLSTSAERDLVLLISYLCCSQELRDGVCRTLADYLEVRPFRDDFGKAERIVDEELDILSALYRKLAQRLQDLTADKRYSQFDVSAAALAWLAREVSAARIRKIDAQGG